MSAPFGHTTVPPSMKYRAKNSGTLSASNIGPSNHCAKSMVFSVPSLKTTPQTEVPFVLGLNDAGKKCHGFFSDSGAIVSSGCPAFIFAQFASSSARCN